jgi:tripartite-type tricarboxylate transporter receptor subunit TctC
MKEIPRIRVARRRAAKLLAACIGMGPLLAAPAFAQWPDKVVRIIVPFSAGGATDVLGRALAVELGKTLKQTVIIENKPGAGGILGAQTVATSPADGYTLLLASGSMFTVNQYIYNKVPYTIDNFEAVTKVASGPMVVTVNADLPVKSTKDLVAYAKSHPGRVRFASAGIGSQTHMAGEAFGDAAGIDIQHVPYKGEGPAYADLMAGTVEMAVGNINAISPLLKGGRLRALSVTGSQRSALLPNVPTTTEDGVPGFEYIGWFALMAPDGTPKAIVDRLYEDIKQAVVQPGMKRYLAEQGMTPAISAPGALKAEIAKESIRWKTLVAKRSITAN